MLTNILREAGDDGEDTFEPIDQPPSAPVVAIEPVRPRDGEALTCTITTPSRSTSRSMHVPLPAPLGPPG